MLSILKPITALLYAVSPVYDRALPALEVALKAESVGIYTASVFNSVATAIKEAITTHNPTLIVGSFYLADEAIVELAKYSFGVLKK